MRLNIKGKLMQPTVTVTWALWLTVVRKDYHYYLLLLILKVICLILNLVRSLSPALLNLSLYVQRLLHLVCMWTL
jgi:hypothetical protein